MTNARARLKQFGEVSREFFLNLVELGKISHAAAPRQTIMLIIIQIVQGLVPLLMAWLLKVLVDTLGKALVDATVTQNEIMLILGGLAAMVIITQGLNATSMYLTGEIGRRSTLHSNRLIFTRLMDFQTMLYFERPDFHDIMQGAERSLGTWTISNLFGDLMSLLTTISFLLILMAISPLLALGLALLFIPMFAVMMRTRRKNVELSWQNSPEERKAWYLMWLLRDSDYAKEIRLFNLGQYFLDLFVKTRSTTDARLRAISREQWWAETGLGIGQALAMIAAIFFVISRAFAGLITIGDVVLYVQAIQNVQSGLQNVARAVANWGEQALSFKHYRNLMSLEPDIKPLEAPQPVPTLQQGIELRNVSFRYTEDGPWVLQDVNLTLHKGECVALVGINGAGKSTLVKLLSRFYEPTSGQILWDGIDIRQFDVTDLRSHLGAVFQDFSRYELTARENIGFGDVTQIENRARIQQVARDIHVDAFIEALPHQYDTVLSRWLVIDKEEGTDLSGGQWQKIAIARMNMRSADLVILDEPTAALDAEAEYEIFLNFATLVKDRTSVLISHRFSTVRMADKIAVLQEGRIQEYGTHDDLMHNDQAYARLYRMQAEQYISSKPFQSDASKSA